MGNGEESRGEAPGSAGGRDGAAAAVGLGSNLGDRAGHLRRTLDRMGERWRLRAVSSVFVTEPVWDGAAPRAVTGRSFLNLCAVLEDAPPPQRLLEELRSLEAREGRDRRAEDGRPAARPLDVDLLLYGGRVIRTDSLVVPHPRMAGRAFVLVPLAEIAGGWRVPGTGRTVAELADAVSGEGVRRVFDARELREGIGEAGR